MNIKSVISAIFIACSMSACSVAPKGVGTHDPYENMNRDIHTLNKGLDRHIIRPIAHGYDTVVPDPIEQGVSNFASNIGLPAKMINNTLQLDLKGLGQNLLRFTINSTLGIGGVFDPSTHMGLDEVDTNFGETLHVWGAPEGAYVELPILGPSTERGAIGHVVDMVINPLAAISQPQKGYITATRAAEILHMRHQMGGQIDGALYESADSYEQLRSIYLQNLRFKLSDDTNTDNVDSLYDDTYFDPYE